MKLLLALAAFIALLLFLYTMYACLASVIYKAAL
jgi:hypothetical protein